MGMVLELSKTYTLIIRKNYLNTRVRAEHLMPIISIFIRWQKWELSVCHLYCFYYIQW